MHSVLFVLHFILAFNHISTVVCNNEHHGVILSGGNMVGAHPNVRDLEYYCLSCGSFSLLNYKLKSARIDSTSAPLGNDKVIVMGGLNEVGTLLASTEIVNHKTKQVTDGPQMAVARTSAASAAYKGEVWVCGGSDGVNTLKSCEALKDRKWKKAPDMIHKRRNAVMAVLGDDLFSIGGSILPDTNSMAKYLYPTEFYNPKSGKWQETSKKAFLPWSRIHSAAAVLHKKIYVCGGINPNGALPNCIKLDKDSCRGSTPWLKVPRGRHALASFDGKLYAFGGQNGNESFSITDTIEEYNPENNQWKIVGKMTSAKADMSAVVVHT